MRPKWILCLGLTACSSTPNASSPERLPAPHADEAPERDVPTDVPPPEEPPAPAPTLRVVLEAHGTLSRVGDRPFFGPYDAGYRRHPALAFGPQAQIEDRIPLPDRDGLFAVGGHWPGPLFTQGAWGDRGSPDQPFILVRFGETWKEARHAKGDYAGDQRVFRWHTRSLLAMSNPGSESTTPPRLAVIAGTPSAPKLAPVLSQTVCRESIVASMAVDIEGPVALTLHCREGDRWLVYWSGDGSQAQSRPLPKRTGAAALDEMRPALGPDGSALFAVPHGQDLTIERRAEGQWRTASISTAGTPLRAAVTDHGTWLLTTTALYEETGAGWAEVEVPGTGALRTFAGLETGNPWLVRQGAQLWWRDERGRWVDVPLPRSPFEDGAYRDITEVLVFGPRDAWFEARLPQPRVRSIRDRYDRALLTTAPAPAPKLAVCDGRSASRIRCDYLTWPTVDPTCTKQLALVVDRKTGAASGHYRPLRKALERSPLPGAPPTFVEATIGHVEVLAAWVESYDQGLALLERAPWKRPAYPRPVCGDEASLAASALVLGETVEVMTAPGR